MRKIYLIFFVVLISCKEVPKGISGKKAHKVLYKSMKATGYESYKKTDAVSFSFRDQHYHFFDKKRGYAEVRWQSWGDSVRVQFEIKTLRGLVHINNRKIEDQNKIQKYIKDANDYYENDIFWLNPIFQANARGSKHFITKDKSLIVKFADYKDKPGDTYQFYFDENHRVNFMRMWVSIIPIDGVEVKFSQPKKYAKDIYISTEHKIMFLNVFLRKIKFYKKYPKKKSDRFKYLALNLGR